MSLALAHGEDSQILDAQEAKREAGRAHPPDLKPILDDMRAASAAVDDANGTSDYNTRLVALALIARHFLRELEVEGAASPQKET